MSHWIEHNEEHADEFRRWADKAGDAVPDVLAAAERIGEINRALAAAMEKLVVAVDRDHTVVIPTGTRRISGSRIHDIRMARKENEANNGH